MYTQISKRRLNTLHKTANSENVGLFSLDLGAYFSRLNSLLEQRYQMLSGSDEQAGLPAGEHDVPSGSRPSHDSRETACLTASQTRADALNSRVRVNFWLQIISTCENETPTTSLRLTSRLALVTKKVLLFPSVD